MARLKAAVLAVLTVLMSVSFTSCTGYGESTFYALDTLIVFKTDKDLPEGLSEYINGYEKRMSRTRTDSYLYMLNEGRAEVCDEETDALIKKAVEISRETDGAFDVTCGALTDLWNIKAEEPTVPTQEMINNALEKVGYGKITFGNDTVQTNGAVIDLGGIAKGYIAEKTVEYLKSNGIDTGIVSFGGNIAVIGPKNGKDMWTVGIKDPADTSCSVGNLMLDSGFVSVSGGYERYFEKDGSVYHHIFDSKTGRPADSDILSASVICSDGALADALSTALYVMNSDAAKRFYRDSRYEFETVMVTVDGKIYVSKGLEGRFYLTSSSYTVEYFGG